MTWTPQNIYLKTPFTSGGVFAECMSVGLLFFWGGNGSLPQDEDLGVYRHQKTLRKESIEKPILESDPPSNSGCLNEKVVVCLFFWGFFSRI